MELDDVLAAIADGDLDGHLDTVIRVIVARAREAGTELTWRMSFDGDEWNAETVLAVELAFAERHCKVLRSDIDPRKSTDHALALLIARLTEVHSLTMADAVKRVGSLTAADIDEIVGVHELVAAPKDGGPTSTGS